MTLRETKWENQTEPKPAMRCSVRARPLRGLAGRSSRPTWANRNKPSDCPQNSAHLTWTQKGELDKAINDYTEAIRLNPNNLRTFHNRGFVLERCGELDRAIKDFTEAIRIDPSYETFYERGSARFKRGEPKKAIEDFAESIRLNPNYVLAYNNRAHSYLSIGDVGHAIADYTEAVRLNPNDSNAYFVLASIFASCPDKEFRNGQKAVQCAQHSCRLTDWKHRQALAALAAAYAEIGNFEEAVNTQERAVDLSNGSEMQEMQQRIALYKQGKPYRGMLRTN